MKRTKRDILHEFYYDARPEMQAIYKNARIVANNTVRYHDLDGNEVIRLHQTDIIVKYPNGDIEFNTGGWYTPTTKERLRRFSGYKVWSEKGIWLINPKNLGYDSTSACYFYDGMKFNGGALLTDAKEPDFAYINRIKKLISKYTQAITKDNLPMPEAGDCWICGIFSQGEDKSCLMSHLEETYVHGTLLVNAMRYAGYSDMQISVHYHMKLVDDFRRAVRKYFKRYVLDELKGNSDGYSIQGR